MKKMKRIFHKYSDWEDFKAGLFDLPSSSENPLAVKSSKMMLSNHVWFRRSALKMVSDWNTAAEVNLSNRSLNRQAWLGQATCCYEFGSKEHQTKEAWRQLTVQEQIAANQSADEIIKEWEDLYA